MLHFSCDIPLIISVLLYAALQLFPTRTKGELSFFFIFSFLFLSADAAAECKSQFFFFFLFDHCDIIDWCVVLSSTFGLVSICIIKVIKQSL